MKIAMLKTAYVGFLSSSAATIAITVEGWGGVALATAIVTAADWIGAAASNYKERPRADALSLLFGRCPVCNSQRLEVTSQNDIACGSCRMVYHSTSDHTVKRMGREETDKHESG